ncbi:MAG: phosphodiester glycosidase family protein [Candidatus Limiplasma sp.]|nr:phosphodiester glycosidase family protein [Candidatus Limiplasma sp.]
MLKLKQCMQTLDFFTLGAKLSDQYSITMVNRVKQLQRQMRVEATGIATPEFQSALFTQYAQHPALTPAPASTPAPQPANATLPEAEAAATPAPTSADDALNGIGARTLQRGLSGNDVRRFKLRLQELGYFSKNAEISFDFNTTTEYKVKQYQNDLGLKPTGIATPELQTIAFSDYGGLATPTPPSAPPLPTLTADGFLPTPNEEFFYGDLTLGQWVYISDTLRIEITRYTRTGNRPLIWYETFIRFTDAEHFQRYNAVQKYKRVLNTEYPHSIAKRNKLVLAFSDDFYGYRASRNEMAGIIIQDGVVVANNTYKSNIVTYLPPLDIMAFFEDGSAKVFYSNECTAKQLLDMGVRDTLSFGPILLRDGQLGQQVADGKYASKEPRCALGMIDARSYVLITVEGRHAKSQGESLSWLATRMRDLGVQQAINLDGGNTTALVYRGILLNKCGTFSGETITLRGVRSVSSILGIGQLHAIDAPTNTED